MVGITDCGTRSQIIVGIVSKFAQPHTVLSKKVNKANKQYTIKGNTNKAYAISRSTDQP